MWGLLVSLLISAPSWAAKDKVVVTGLDSPWAVVASPAGEIWITEIGGDIKVYNSSFVHQRTLSGVPGLRAVGQGGLLDLAFHPQFLQNGWIYLAYTVDDGGYHTRISRFTVRGNQLKDMKLILEGPTGDDSAHFGCRLVFDAQGFLYASFGERHQKEKAQKLNSLHGKTVRLHDDGSIPGDNPFSGNPIFTLGHRNPQGLDIHPGNQRLYVSEHGPTGYDAPGGGDELNELKAGANYGWPNFHHDMTAPGMTAPMIQFTPAIAPSGAVFYTGGLIPGWHGDFFVANLRGTHLLRVRISNAGHITTTEKLLVNKYGRLRDVGNAPDGSLLVLSDDGRLIQLTP
jgi:glucose/arabinose dehydrogenase